MKYIQNTYTSDIQIQLKENGHFLKSVDFGRYLIDRATGQVVNDGFTEVEDDDYALLEKNNAFKMVVNKGWLVVSDKAPLKAGSFEQMLEAQARIKELEAENEELKSKVKDIEAYAAENKELKEKLAAYEKAADAGTADSEAASTETKETGKEAKAGGNKAKGNANKK